MCEPIACPETFQDHQREKGGERKPIPASHTSLPSALRAVLTYGIPQWARSHKGGTGLTLPYADSHLCPPLPPQVQVGTSSIGMGMAPVPLEAQP